MRLFDAYQVLTGRIDLHKVVKMTNEALDQRDRAMTACDSANAHLALAKDGIRDLKDQLRHHKTPFATRDIQNALASVGVNLTPDDCLLVLATLLDPEARRRAASDAAADKAIERMMKQ